MPDRIVRLALGLACAVALTGADLPAKPAAPATTPDAEHPRFYASWHRPAGMPGATPTLVPTCADSTHRDTLWLSFEPSQDESSYVGVGGEIEIYSQPQDTLGDFWGVGRDQPNHGGLTAVLGPNPDFPGESPWTVGGFGAANYDHTPRNGRFRFVYVQPMSQGVFVKANRRYTLGCLILRGQRANLAGCEAQVCIEWRRAEFVWGPGRDFWYTTGGQHIVARGGTAEICRDRLPAWRPPVVPAEVEADTTWDPASGRPRR